MIIIDFLTICDIVNDFTSTKVNKEEVLQSLKSRDIIDTTKENKQSCDRLIGDAYGDVDDH